jgi:hypothetical protein
VVVAEPVSGDDIAAHVASHLSNREFEQRASHLGERVGLADDDLAAHLQQVFDHHVGSIGTPGTARMTGEETNAANMSLEILATFRDPTMLRRAIILNEVLTPPTQRW